MFHEIGKDATDYFIENVIGDGACGFRCCHNENKFRKIRKDINKFIIHHWELLELQNFYGNFEDGIKFNVGMSTETFQSQMQFMCFLDSAKADLLWMDHLDLKMASNTYNLDINILSLQLEKPTWTKILRDSKLKDPSCEVCKLITYKIELPKQLFMLHKDNHYRIFARKTSVLAESLGYKVAPQIIPASLPKQQAGECQVSPQQTKKCDVLPSPSQVQPRKQVLPSPPQVQPRKQTEKYCTEDEEGDSKSDEWETDSETEGKNASSKVGYIGHTVKEDYKKLYELLIEENNRLTAELRKYFIALKEKQLNGLRQLT